MDNIRNKNNVIKSVLLIVTWIIFSSESSTQYYYGENKTIKLNISIL